MENELISLIKIIACDIANEIIELNKNNKESSEYSKRVFDYLKQNKNPLFYLSNRIDRYDQVDETNVKERENSSCHVLYVDDLPIVLITSDIREESVNKLDYYYYSVDDDKFLDILSSDSFYLINANDYGFYLVNDNDCYGVSQTINDVFMNQFKQLNISINKVNKEILDLELIDKTDFIISIKDYDDVDDSVLTSIKNHMKENEELSDCILFGPITSYQYSFTHNNTIEVCDYGRENDAYCFGLIKNSTIKAFINYDRFDDEITINPISDLKYDGSYFVNLSDVGYVYEDRISNKTSYSLLKQLIITRLQEKITKEKPVFKTYDLK